jgi:hypothetical protein
MSQAEIEARFFDRAERIRRGELQPEQAFAEEGDWLLELGERRFLLHPGTVRWLIYDRGHDDWYDTGYGPGQALLVAEGKQAGVLRIPEASRGGEPATAAGWCLVTDGERPLGVRRADDVRRAQANGWLPPGARVWDGDSGQWQTVEAFAGPAGIPPADGQPPEWITEQAVKAAAPGPERDPVVEAPAPPVAADVSPVVQTPPSPVAVDAAPVVQTTPPPLSMKIPSVPERRPVFCGQCGARLSPQARFCGTCGRAIG